MLGEDIHHPAPNRPLKRRIVLVIDGDPELCPARPFPTKRSITIGIDTKAALQRLGERCHEQVAKSSF